MMSREEVEMLLTLGLSRAIKMKTFTSVHPAVSENYSTSLCARYHCLSLLMNNFVIRHLVRFQTTTEI
jgi:hypothetical protein